MQAMLDTILNVFNHTDFRGKVCAWHLEYTNSFYDPIFTIEFKPDDKMHIIQGIVPTDVALKVIEMLGDIGYEMVEIDDSTVQ
jgi:hypothetical protein